MFLVKKKSSTNYNKKYTAKLTTNPIKMHVSINANAIIVVLNKFSPSSGFLETAMLYEANKIPILSAAKAIGYIANEKVNILTPCTINIKFFKKKKDLKNLKKKS